MTDKSRAAFEAWAHENNCYGTSRSYSQARYDEDDTEAAWTAWQAAYQPTAPAQLLTDAELDALYDKIAKYQEYGAAVSGWYDFARAIEQAHGIKGASL
jgi:hypothetical protein